MAREPAAAAGHASWKPQLKPAAEDFETGEVVLLKDGDIRIPGLPA